MRLFYNLMGALSYRSIFYYINYILCTYLRANYPLATNFKLQCLNESIPTRNL